MSKLFEVIHSDNRARAGELTLQNGAIKIDTPFFMPVGTLAAVKGMWQDQLSRMGYRLILGNTYHLYLRPGTKIIEKSGGLANFQNWSKALLTDSGGYQVYSLSDRVRFLQQGVEFASHIDGSRHLFTPQSVLDTQAIFDSDILMILDDCAPADADPERLNESLDRTHRWAKQSIDHFHKLCAKGKLDSDKNKIFGIVQGGLDYNKRAESLEKIQSMPFDGIAIGGLSVGEKRSSLYEMLDFIGETIDPDRPRYLMGVGTIVDILEAVKNGFDMFDCVLPTRNARNGQFITSKGRLNIRNSHLSNDFSKIDPECKCTVCNDYSRAYLHHLFRCKEMSGPMMATYHNLFFYKKFMENMRESIIMDRFEGFFKKYKKIHS